MSLIYWTSTRACGVDENPLGFQVTTSPRIANGGEGSWIFRTRISNAQVGHRHGNIHRADGIRKLATIQRVDHQETNNQNRCRY